MVFSLHGPPLMTENPHTGVVAPSSHKASLGGMVGHPTFEQTKAWTFLRGSRTVSNIAFILNAVYAKAPQAGGCNSTFEGADLTGR